MGNECDTFLIIIDYRSGEKEQVILVLWLENEREREKWTKNGNLKPTIRE